MITRVGDLAQNGRMTRQMLETQTSLRTINEQIATGKLNRRYDALGDDASLLVRTQSTLDRTGNYIAENQRTVGRAQAMDLALSDMIDVMTRLRTLMVQRLDATAGGELPLDVEADAMADQMVGLSNRSVDGRYLFAGSKTDTAPVALPAAPLLNPVAADYYRGDDIALAARVDVEVTLTYGIHAGEQPFLDAFAALANAKEGHVAGDRSMLETALDKANAALDGIIRRRAELGTTTARIEAIAASQEGSKLYLQDTLSSLNDTDIPMAMSQLALHQVSLEASYATLAKLANLNLTDYLR